MSRKQAPISLVVYTPKSNSGRQELARRVAEVHGTTVCQYISQQACPPAQKEQLFDCIIRDAKSSHGE